MNIKYIVELNESEREFLLDLISKGIANARKLKRANILLMAENESIRILISLMHYLLEYLRYIEQSVPSLRMVWMLHWIKMMSVQAELVY